MYLFFDTPNANLLINQCEEFALWILRKLILKIIFYRILFWSAFDGFVEHIKVKLLIS